MKKKIFISIVCAGLLFTGCNQEKETVVVKAEDAVTVTMETEVKEKHLKERAQKFADDGAAKIKEVYEKDVKGMLDSAYKLSLGYTNSIKEKAKVAIKEMSTKKVEENVPAKTESLVRE